MRNTVLDRTIRMMMIAGAALMLASCGHGDASNNSSGGGGGGASGNDSGSGAEGVTDNADLGDNDMDGNVAQLDQANGTTVSGQPVKSAGSGAK